MTAILERFTPAAHFYPGDISGIRTALVLACPGRFEEKRAKASGKHLGQEPGQAAGGAQCSHAQGVHLGPAVRLRDHGLNLERLL
jgi:hypothetical protein